MSDLLTEKSRDRFRTSILQFLRGRLDAKLEKLAEDDPNRDDLIAQYAAPVWLEDAARRVRQIQVVTHSLKPIHPDARGTNLYVLPEQMEGLAEVGSHVLGQDFSGDVVGNAAALDIYKLLKLEVDGRTLLDWLLAGDSDAIAALSDDSVQAQAWMDAFAGVTRPRDGVFASHARAKQLYWFVGENPVLDEHYELLAPLYASSLAHAVFQIINEDRFGEQNKLAREARRERKDYDDSYRSYPDLAVQKLGGTKPQNISQLNSERGGNNYLLGSLPPVWQSREIRTPWQIDSVFEHLYGQRREVWLILRDFRKFLESAPPSTMETRDRVDAYVDVLIGELVVFAAEFQNGLPPGWSSDHQCRLVQAERLWLDPRRAEIPSEEDFYKQWLWMDWPKGVGARFGNWLNAQLNAHGKLPLGDIEQRYWQRELLLDESQDGWAQHLRQLRRTQDSPTYIPTRNSMGEGI